MSKEDEVRQKLVNIYLKYYGSQDAPKSSGLTEGHPDDLAYCTYQPQEGDTLPEPSSDKPHIVINKYRTYYALLDCNFNIIDSISVNPISSFVLRFSRKFKFKRTLHADLKQYKKACKVRYVKPRKKIIRPNKKIIKMHKEMSDNLKLCPDADFYILQLLRRNITNLSLDFNNYQTACALYLQELSKLNDGDPDQLPFDINFATSDNRLCIDHKYISNTFISNSKDAVNDFIKAYQKPISQRDKFLMEHRLTTPKPPEKFEEEYSSERSIRMKPRIVEDRIL